MRNKKEEHRLVLAWTLFIVYMVFLMYFLFFAEIMGRTYIDRDYHYNLTPFREIRRFIVYRRTLGWFAVLSNLLGNVLAFVPFGMILPMLTPKCGRSDLKYAWSCARISGLQTDPAIL